MPHNKKSSLSSWLAILLVFGVLVGALYGMANQRTTTPPDIIAMDFNPKLELIDQNGKLFRIDESTDSYALIYFGYSFCPDICPTELQKMALAAAQLPPNKQHNLKLIFVTVDPKRDTAEHLKDYVNSFDPAMIGLTGDEAQIKSVASQYKVYYDTPAAQDKNYLVNHTSLFYVLAPGAKSVGIMKSELNSDQIAFNLRLLIP